SADLDSRGARRMRISGTASRGPVPSSNGSSKRPAANERAPSSLFPELRLGPSHKANDASRERGESQLVAVFVEHQLEATDVAPVDALWLWRIAGMCDLRLASRTFPRHRCTQRGRGAILVPAGLPAELRCRCMSCAKGQPAQRRTSRPNDV